METIKRMGLKVAAASAGIALISGCGSVAPMASNTKELGTTSEVSSSFSTNRGFFDLKEIQREKKRKDVIEQTSVLTPITPTTPTTIEVVPGDLPDATSGKLMTYVVKKGDTLSHIARNFQVGVEELAHWNKMGKNDTLMAGTRLSLPPTAQRRTGGEAPASGPDAYTVVKGDTLSRIAARHNVSVKQLKEWNGLASDAIRAGQTLALGPGGLKDRGFKPRKRPIPRDGVHVVKSGENLSSIAYMYGMKTSELKALNNLSGDKIIPDQKLKLREGMGGEPTSSNDARDVPMGAFTGTTTYVVKNGDILGRIAPKFGVTVAQIMKANGMTNTRIRVGQKLEIPTRGETVADAPKEPTPEYTQPEEVVSDPRPTPTPEPSTPPAKADKDEILIPHFVDKDSDTLKGIAEMYGSTIDAILKANPKVKGDADLAKVAELSIPVPNLSTP